MRLRLNGFLLLLLAGVIGCAGHGSSVPPAPSSHARSASVSFSITLPKASPTTAAHRHHTFYENPFTASVSVAVTQGSSAATTTTFPCVSGVCTGQATAPIGFDTFAVTLWSGPGGTGSALSSGTQSQTISAGSQRVNLTFNPVVASVSLETVTQPSCPAGYSNNSSSICPLYLNPTSDSTNGPQSVEVQLVARDALAHMIIGPGNFIDSNGNPLTFTVASSDTSGATTILPATPSFTAPAALGSLNSLTIGVANAAALQPFDDPYLSISVTGGSVASNAGLDVPVTIPDCNPIDPQNCMTIQSAWSDSGFSATSLAGSEAVVSVSSTFPPAVYAIGSGPSSTTTVESNAGFARMLVAELNGNAPDGNYWYFAGPLLTSPPGNNWFGMSTMSGCGSTSSCLETPFTSDVILSMVSDSSSNIWFADATTPGVGVIRKASPSVAPTFVPNLMHQGASVSALFAGAPGTVDILQTAGSQTWLDTINSSLDTFIESGPFTLPAPVNIAGYSQLNSMVYVVSSDGSISQVSAGGAVSLAPGAPAPAAGILNIDVNHQPMSRLADGSLVFVGQNSNQYAAVVHIVPGRVPSAVSILPALPINPTDGSSGSQAFNIISQIWSLEPNGSINSTDGGHVRVAVW